MKKQKSGKLNTEALQLVSVQTKRSIPQAVCASGVLLGIFLAGSLCWLIQSLSLELFTWAPAMAAVVFAALQCSAGTGRKQGIRSLIWAAVLGVLALIFQRWFRDGIYQISNAVMEVLGNRYPYVLPHYAVTLEGRDAVLALTGTVVWLMGVCALAGGFLIRSENWFLLGTLVVLTLLLYRVTGIGPAFSGWIVGLPVWRRSGFTAMGSAVREERAVWQRWRGWFFLWFWRRWFPLRREASDRFLLQMESGYFPVCGRDLRKAWTKRDIAAVTRSFRTVILPAWIRLRRRGRRF